MLLHPCFSLFDHLCLYFFVVASTEKQMLGTETVRSLRCVGGVKSIICGLSANDMEAKFLESGADTFLLKPFPCQKAAMSEAFYNVLRCRERNKN